LRDADAEGRVTAEGIFAGSASRSRDENIGRKNIGGGKKIGKTRGTALPNIATQAGRGTALTGGRRSPSREEI